MTRLCGLWLAGLLLAGCATSDIASPDGSAALAETPAPAQHGDSAVQLSAQELALGECGVFFWGVSRANPFLAFENESRGQARIFADGREHGFDTPPQQRQPLSGDPYRRRFIDPERGLNFEIHGVFGEAMRDGVRIERAVLRHIQPDGAAIVTPVAGFHACRSAG
jgi:hypothetical protein